MRYRTEVDLENQNSSQAALARMIVGQLPTGARVLDIGCAAGDLGAALIERGYKVAGIEVDADLAAVATERLDEVVNSNLESAQLSELVSGKFDAIIFGDVLEHLQDPIEILEAATSLLSDNGFVAASIPNIAHGAMRLALLQGSWKYTDEGLLDRTHLRFFTLGSIKELFSKAELVIDEIYATVLDPLAAGVDIADDALPGDIVEWVRDQEGAFDFQYIVRAHPVRAGSMETECDNEIRRLIPLPRPDDAHTERRRELRLAQLRAEKKAEQLAGFEVNRDKFLTLRDYAIGIEEEAGRLRYQIQQQARDLHQVRTELIETHQHLAEAIADDQAAHARLHETLEALNGGQGTAGRSRSGRSLLRRGVGKIARKLRLR